MRNSLRLFRVFGISINIHISFLLLFIIFWPGGIRWAVVVAGVFAFVTMHEICHSLVARAFGIRVREITLLPIGGVASMDSMPEKPYQEFLISIAGPLFNLAVVAIFFYPMRYLLGDEVLFARPLSAATWPLAASYLYWINLMLALFNLLPAFPMDGGRVVRSILASRMGNLKATRIAALMGHVFAVIFVYLGITRGSIILVAIAIFIYLAASNEMEQAELKEALKKFRDKGILHNEFFGR